MNFLDRFIEFVSPELAFKREQFRSATTMLRGFEGASRGTRRTKNWKTGPGSANTEASYSLGTLRDRSRDLERNNPYAKRSIKVIANNVVGWGIKPTVSDPELQILFDRWADKKKNCDFNGRLNFYGIQKQIIKSVVRDGEVLVRKRRSKNGSGVPIQLQVCEAEFIDTSRSMMPIGDGQDFIIQGVQFDANGKRKGYWMYNRHPSDGYNYTSSFVPESDVLHIYVEDRPGQVRGIPHFAAVILRLRDFDEYEDATLTRQKIAACFTTFVSDPVGNVVAPNQDDDDLPDRVGPGMIYKTKPSQTVTFGNPPAADGFSDYSKTTLRGIAAGAGVTYEAMTGDLSNVNFSSGRMGWLEFSRDVEDLQWQLMIPMFCEDVFDWFVDAAAIAFGRQINTDATCAWTPPARQMIDPVKETKGMMSQIRNGLISWQEAVRTMGYDPKEVIKEMTQDMEAWDGAGLKLDCDGRVDAPPENTQAENDNE